MIQSLLLAVREARANNKRITIPSIRRLELFQRGMRETADAMQEFTRQIESILYSEVEFGLRSGLHDGIVRLRRKAPNIPFAELSEEGQDAFIEAYMRRLPIREDTLARFPEKHQKHIEKSILLLLLSSLGTSIVYDRIYDIFGKPLTNALRIIDHEQFRAYREAMLAQWRYNERYVTGWIWVSQRDSRTCLSCWALDGTWFPIWEPFSDHPNGRCYPEPALAGEENRFAGRGEKEFISLPEDIQLDIMGPGKYNLWRQGKVKLSDFIDEYNDPLWGRMYREKPLKKLRGE